METFLGILIGVLATVLVGHYYFKKTTLKRLSPYITLRSHVFAGIEENVRKLLRFTFKGKDIQELQQLEFLIANDGEKAISACIEPLTLELPKGSEVLDSTVLYKNPNDLVLEVKQTELPSGNVGISFIFPLLNKGDYFLTKLLLSGSVAAPDLCFHVMADDLPRTLHAEWLPSEATRKRKWKVEWSAFVVGLFMILFTAALVYALSLLQSAKPEVFPFPWKTYTPTVLNIAFLVGSGLGVLTLGLIGIVLTLAIGLEDVLKKGPKFPLPEEFQRHGGRFDFEMVMQQMTAMREELDRQKSKETNPPNKAPEDTARKLADPQR